MNISQQNNGYIFDGEFFVSFQEVQCYRYLKFLGIPNNKMHHEYRVSKNCFDFFPLKRIFWEHHPINKKLGKDIFKYGKKRRAILDENGYRNIPLVVSDVMFEDITDICIKMRENNVDFRKGRVPRNVGIYYIRDYEKEYERYCFNVLCETLVAD
ncbi:hypothetical protein GF319_15205 [Candidatus Bathyarchaeota archaeon]|nr:hypothetical protein [Candidatus Bathyarchaeota archaeon]